MEMNSDEKEVQEVLHSFLQAFENCDLPKMEYFFAEDAVMFPQVVMSSMATEDIDPSKYRRYNGMSPDMKRATEELPKQVSGPPYRSLVPEDLKIQLFLDVAVATFHLHFGQGIFGRRTIVFAKRNSSWKIVHIHPSSVQVAHGK